MVTFHDNEYNDIPSGDFPNLIPEPPDTGTSTSSGYVPYQTEEEEEEEEEGEEEEEEEEGSEASEPAFVLMESPDVESVKGSDVCTASPSEQRAIETDLTTSLIKFQFAPHEHKKRERPPHDEDDEDGVA